MNISEAIFESATMIMRIQAYCTVTVGLLVVTVGCGRGDSNLPKLMPVSGAVTLNGKLLSGATIAFVPNGATRGTGANGYTDAAGHYELMAKSGKKGVPAGEYRVVITKFVMPDGSDFPADSKLAPIESSAKQSLPPKYSEADQTVLKANVSENACVIDFPLSGKP